MSFESVNISNNSSPEAESKIEKLKSRLKPYFFSLEDPSLISNMEIFITNSEKYPEIEVLAEEYPGFFDLLFYYVGNRDFSAEEAKSFVYNFRQRQEEVLENRREINQRIEENPHASEEEYELGLFKESLERQVRGAVLSLRGKGYSPFGSGFDDLVSGTQSLFLEDDDGIDISVLQKSLPEFVSVIKERGRIVISFIPGKENYTIDDLKLSWDAIASLLPVHHKQINRSRNGKQGEEFRQTQDDMAAGKKTWLGDGRAFINGAVIKISKEEFLKIH